MSKLGVNCAKGADILEISIQISFGEGGELQTQQNRCSGLGAAVGETVSLGMTNAHHP